MTGTISRCVANFQATKNPLHLLKAACLAVYQGRTRELLYGFYCKLFHPPLPVTPHLDKDTNLARKSVELLLATRSTLTRDDLVQIYGGAFAVDHLPADFRGARTESVVCDRRFLILGEYGNPGKRIAYVSRLTCSIDPFYCKDSHVKHIHAVHRAAGSDEVLVATGDSAKYLDHWRLRDGGVTFERRVRRHLAGYTGIAEAWGTRFLGSDFTGRPNYIESLDGKKYFFPEKARNMYVARFLAYQDRYILSLNKDLHCLGGRYTLSLFDAKRKLFVSCDYLDYSEPVSADRALHRLVISYRTGSTVRFGHSSREEVNVAALAAAR